MLRSVCTLTLCKSLRSGVICPVIGGLFAHDLWSNSFVMSVLFVHRRSVGLVCTSTPEVQLGRQSAVEDTSEIVGLVWALSRYSRHQACKLRRLGVVSIGGEYRRYSTGSAKRRGLYPLWSGTPRFVWAWFPTHREYEACGFVVTESCGRKCSAIASASFF